MNQELFNQPRVRQNQAEFSHGLNGHARYLHNVR